jgi:phage-related baseplate assembly protein
MSAIIAAIHVAGVQRVELASPDEDQVMTMLQAGWCSGVDLSYAGVDE